MSIVRRPQCLQNARESLQFSPASYLLKHKINIERFVLYPERASSHADDVQALMFRNQNLSEAIGEEQQTSEDTQRVRWFRMITLGRKEPGPM